jgi:hypothetical protein
MNFSPAQSRCDFNLSEGERKIFLKCLPINNITRAMRLKRADREGNHSETISLSVGLHGEKSSRDAKRAKKKKTTIINDLSW